MIGNEVIQADVLAEVLSTPAITAFLATAGEVRETQYQGTVFLYPAVRVGVESQVPITNRGPSCDHARLSLLVTCYSELDSSRQADSLAALVNAHFHNRQFFGTAWYTWFRSTGLRRAVRLAERVWRADVPLAGTVYHTVPV